MRKLLLVCALAVGAGACAPIGATVVATPYYDSPAYVYSYPDGSCWADDLWYPQCPWYFGDAYGYYGYYGGRYYWYHDYRWNYRPHRPPPRVWRHTHPRPGHRYVPPPRVRDHRHYRPVRPRVRDHR